MTDWPRRAECFLRGEFYFYSLQCDHRRICFGVENCEAGVTCTRMGKGFLWAGVDIQPAAIPTGWQKPVLFHLSLLPRVIAVYNYFFLGYGLL